MSKTIMKEIKRNKYSIIVFCIFVALFIMGWSLFGLIMPKTNGEQYGNRLDSIKEEYGDLQKAEEATKEAGGKIVETLKKKSYVNDAHIDIKGKILNIIVEVKSGTSEKTAKELGDVVLNSANDKTKKLYDLQLFITNEKKDAKGFPIIGYKNFKEKSFAF